MRYNTNLTAQLAQGAALINETLILLSSYKEGMTRREFSKYVIENGLIPSSTSRRISNVVEEVFFKRFVERNQDVCFWLRRIRERGLMMTEFRQLLMLYCARDNALYYEFVINVINKYRRDAITVMDKSVAVDYLRALQANDLICWKDTVHRKISSSLNTAAAAFDQVSSKGEVLPYRASDFTVLYIMHEMHFSGMSDVAIVNDTDWQLFNMDKHEVIRRILDLSLKGGYIAQQGGELITISWNHKSMEDFIDATL